MRSRSEELRWDQDHIIAYDVKAGSCRPNFIKPVL
jgi:hypothetical protein